MSLTAAQRQAVTQAVPVAQRHQVPAEPAAQVQQELEQVELLQQALVAQVASKLQLAELEAKALTVMQTWPDHLVLQVMQQAEQLLLAQVAQVVVQRQ